MAEKIRNYDDILKGCKPFADAVEQIRRHAKMLNHEAEAASSYLKDEVAKKNIDTIKDLAETILRVTDKGEERIRELERRMQKEKKEYDILR